MKLSARIEELNDVTKASYAQREKTFYDRVYFLLRKHIFELTVVDRVRRTLAAANSLQGSPTVRILDVGCKYGDKTDAIARATVSEVAQEIDVHGIDLHLPEQQAEPQDPRIRLQRVECPLEALDASQHQPFDVISAMAVTHHFPDLDQAFGKMQQLLAPDGVIFMADTYFRPIALFEAYVKWYEKLECDGHFNRVTDKDVISSLLRNRLKILAHMWGFPMLSVTLATHERGTSSC